ncbi:MAG: hypothetical protein R3F55_14995 [Alphaproteobacteria bacterium]
MHDIDRVQAEALDDSEFDFEADDEFFEAEADDDAEIVFESDEEEFDEFEAGSGGPFDEATEMELAAELLEVQSDEELEQFLGKLFKRAVRGARRFARSSAGRTLGRALKGVAKKALPVAGRAVGTFFGGPAGGAIGGKVGGFASSLFELELEGMSPEDQEFEVAKRFVRLAGTAARATAARARTSPPTAAAKAGLTAAARQHAPGLARRAGMSAAAGGRAASGRWFRRGNRIVLVGA